MPSRPLEVQRFFYHLTFLCNQIWGNADSILLFFNHVWYFSKALLNAYICYLPARNHQDLGGGRGKGAFCSRISCYYFCLVLLKFSLTKISVLCHFCRPWGLLIACCIEQRTPPREISTSVFESWAETAQENSSLEPVAFSLLSVSKTLLPSVRK